MLTASLTAMPGQALAAPLQVKVFNPGEEDNHEVVLLCSSLNSKGTGVSSSLLVWTAPRHRVPELALSATKTGAVHDTI